MASPERAQRAFRRLATATMALTYFLISVGAFVRVSGAGMGCPDWPKCFGLWVPPTSASDLPPLGSYTYPPGWRVESFDPLMTWIEYVNRLIGALVGLFILATLVTAVVAFRRRLSVMAPTIVAFVGVLYAAWLGARVVAHELAPWIVTAHLLSAIAVVSALVVAVVNAGAGDERAAPPGTARLSLLAWLTMSLALLQGAVGTQVRGTLEDIARARPDVLRGDLIDHVGALDVIHRNLALAVVAACVAVAVQFAQTLTRAHAASRAATVAAGLAVLQLVGGGVLVNLALPRGVQVLHLLGSALMLGALTAAAMLVRRRV